MAVITRWSYKRGGRKAGFHCIICSQKNTTIKDIFVTGVPYNFDKWTLERRKAGNTILG